MTSEPTSALDPESIELVEKTLKSRTCVWITHDPEQQERVATNSLTIGNSKASTPAESINSQDDDRSSATTINMKSRKDRQK